MAAKKKPVSFARRLKLLRACETAVEWCGKRKLATAWRECPQAEWMFWLLENSVGWSRDVLNVCLLDIMAAALESARAVSGNEAYWAQVEAAHRQVREAMSGRGDTASARAASWAASWAAEAAAWAAGAARASWAAAEAAARAAKASLAASAAEAAAWAARAAMAASWAAANRRLADIVRKHFPKPPKLAAQSRSKKP